GSKGASKGPERTISIEVGMQNSGLATVLARSHFSDPLTAIPGAMSAAIHSILGSSLAALWRARSPEESPSIGSVDATAAGPRA
ncbi:MAG: hypothetical protein AAF658_06535, partial [Myxococcota bacterium]